MVRCTVSTTTAAAAGLSVALFGKQRVFVDFTSPRHAKQSVARIKDERTNENEHDSTELLDNESEDTVCYHEARQDHGGDGCHDGGPWHRDTAPHQQRCQAPTTVQGIGRNEQIKNKQHNIERDGGFEEPRTPSFHTVEFRKVKGAIQRLRRGRDTVQAKPNGGHRYVRQWTRQSEPEIIHDPTIFLTQERGAAQRVQHNLIDRSTSVCDDVIQLRAVSIRENLLIHKHQVSLSQGL